MCPEGLNDPGLKRRFQRAVIKWAHCNLRKFPWRAEKSPYKVLITEVLLRRTTATAVLRVYEKFFTLYPSVKELANADEEELQDFLSTIGYQKQRAKILKEIAEYIVKEHHAVIPRTTDALLKIPHVGYYTSNAVLSFSFNVPRAVVDSNVERILRRAFASTLGKAPLSHVQKTADSLLPKRGHKLYNLALLDIGAMVCRYDTPRCAKCPLSKVCDTSKNINKQLTQKKPREKAAGYLILASEDNLGAV